MSLNRYIAISIDPATHTGAMTVASSLRRGGWRSELFTTSGAEGGHFERTILRDPSVQAVVDFSFCDLLMMRLKLCPTTTPERMTSAASLGVPLVIVPGSLDHVIVKENQETLLPRRALQLDETTTVFRTTPNDNDALGKELAFKASASKGPVAIVFPGGGLSQWDQEGEPLYDRASNRAILDSLHLWKAPQVELVESHRHINDPLFGHIVVEQILKLLVVRR